MDYFLHIFYKKIKNNNNFISAMGPRPVFDFPDHVVIPTTPLKVEKDILVSFHNIGAVPGGFTLATRW